MVFYISVFYYAFYPLHELFRVKQLVENETGGDIRQFFIYMRVGMAVLFMICITVPFVIFSLKVLSIFGPIILVLLVLYVLSFISFGFNLTPVSDIIDEELDDDKVKPNSEEEVTEDASAPTATLTEQQCKQIRTSIERWRKAQDNILFVYRSDMSKHVSPNEATRISMVWQSVPSQLAKENKKFIYGAVREGARAKDFEMAIQWLVDAGLVYRISRVRDVGMPLKFYEDLTAFKLFLLDVGLLGALSEMEPSQMLISNKAMTESKGAFTENYVLCQLMSMENMHVYYFQPLTHHLLLLIYL